MTQEQACNTCKRKAANIKGTVTFNCPSCKEKIVRCGHCREITAKYECGCGLKGP